MESRSYDEWDMKVAEWRGHVLGSIDGLNKEVSQLREDIKEYGAKIDKLDDRLTNLQVKVAGIGAISGLVVSIIGFLVMRGLG